MTHLPIEMFIMHLTRFLITWFKNKDWSVLHSYYHLWFTYQNIFCNKRKKRIILFLKHLFWHHILLETHAGETLWSKWLLKVYFFFLIFFFKKWQKNQDESSSRNPSNQQKWAIWECEISGELRIRQPWNGWVCNPWERQKNNKR